MYLPFLTFAFLANKVVCLEVACFVFGNDLFAVVACKVINNNGNRQRHHKHTTHSAEGADHLRDSNHLHPAYWHGGHQHDHQRHPDLAQDGLRGKVSVAEGGERLHCPPHTLHDHDDEKGWMVMMI